MRSMARFLYACLQVEYHVMPPDRVNKGGDTLTPRAMLHIMRALQDRGLRVFHSEPNYWRVACSGEPKNIKVRYLISWL